jgi:TPR repeat protein
MSHTRNPSALGVSLEVALLFNTTMVRFQKIKNKKNLIQTKMKLKDDLLTLLDVELTDRRKDTVCDALLLIVDKIGDYALVKSCLHKIINAKGVSRRMLGVVYAYTAKVAYINKDPEVPIKKIELYYKLAVEYQCQNISKEVHYALGEYHILDKRHAEALFHFDKLILVDDIDYKITGYFSGGVCLQALNKLVLAQQYYEKCVAIYEANPAQPPHCLETISNCAHNCAKLLDNYDGDITSDSERALYYYRIAAKLKNKYSLHDLAYKYEHGEDVLVDKKKAISFYRQAVNLGNIDSTLNLYLLLEETHQDSSEQFKILKKMHGDSLVCRNVSVVYLQKYRSELQKFENHDDAKKLPQVIEYADLAFQYSLLAAASDEACAIFNLGVFYHLGIGTERNESLAEKYYLRARDRGLRGIDGNLSNLYQDKLIEFKDHPSTMLEFNILDRKDVTDTTGRSVVKKQYFESKLLEQSLKINTDINEIANEEISHQHKITRLLEHDVITLDIVNIVTLLHRLGTLTEKSLNRRDFHNAQLPRIFEFIREAEKKLDLNLFDGVQVTHLIESMSKLYLQPQVNNIGEFIQKLYVEALRLLDKLDSRSLTTIVYAASRLDAESSILKDILPTLIQCILDKKDDLDLYGFAKCIYAVAIFDNTKKGLINEGVIKLLLQFSSQIFKTTVNAKMRLQIIESELIIIRQLYTASFYFSKKYPHLVTSSQSKSLEHWKSQLLKVPAHGKVSILQSEVTCFIKQYFPECHIERLINTLPVDAFFELSIQQGFILQVDGPSHFLHASENTPKPTQKSQFRSAFLKLEHPVICVDYYDWDTLKTDKQKADYLTALAKTIDVTLEDKWETPRSYPKTLFSAKEPKTPTTPKTATSPQRPAPNSA